MTKFAKGRSGRGFRAASAAALGGLLAATTPSRADFDWTGAVSTDWFDAGNWSGGVPTNGPSGTDPSAIIDTIRSDKSFAVSDAVLTLRGRAGWAHDFNTGRAASATFQALPGASFIVNGAASARDAALTTASAEMKWQSGISLAGSFEGEFSQTTRSYAGKGTARYSW